MGVVCMTDLASQPCDEVYTDAHWPETSYQASQRMSVVTAQEETRLSCRDSTLLHITFHWENEGKMNVNTGVIGSSPRAVLSLNKDMRSQSFDPVNTQKPGNEDTLPLSILPALKAIWKLHSCEAPEGTQLMVSPGGIADIFQLV